MDVRLKQFADAYAADEEKTAGQGDGRSSIHYPAVFLFIGDLIQDAVRPVMQINAQKWDNSAGVMYVEIAPEPTGEEQQARRANEARYEQEQNVNFMRTGQNTGSLEAQKITTFLSRPTVNDHSKKTQRPDWHHHFQKDGKHLLELNRTFRQAARRLAEFGRMYSSFDRLHVSVITRVDDPMNILVPEISLLARSILGQSFKSVQMDMYALIYEGDQEEQFGYASSAGVAFLKELEHIQSADYTLTAPLQRTEDGLAVMVQHSPSPLFELAYVLSDRNERGISVNGGMESSYDIICRISLLKNRQRLETGGESSVYGSDYNNNAFKNNVRNGEGNQGLVSAGFARVRRPDRAIALTVLEQFFYGIMKRMKHTTILGSRDKFELLGLDEQRIDERVDMLVPNSSRLEDMNGLMTRTTSFSHLKSLSLREAEHALFETGGESFFYDNYEQEMIKRLDQWDAGRELQANITEMLRQHPHLHFYQLAEWTDESGEQSIWNDYHARTRDLMNTLERAQAELDEWYDSRTDDLSFQRLPFMEKHNIRGLTRALIDTIYPRKLHILRLQTRLRLYRRFEEHLTTVHLNSMQQVKSMDTIGSNLQVAATDSIRTADDYIGQNIHDYYSRLTAEVMDEIEEKRGDGAFFEERSVGDVTLLLQQGASTLVERLMDVCRKELLASRSFTQTFEQELLNRANVTIAYENKQALSQEDLFKELYRTLEDRAVIHIRLLDYTHKHRYEEKYMFGNANGEFVRYAAGVDNTTRIYKTGFVHEDRTSGVEKLNLMGGFTIEDLIYYRNGKTYYDTYIANGYNFHV